MKRMMTAVFGFLSLLLMAPPGVAAERGRILRVAYTKALTDPELLAEAKKKNLEIDPTSGEELEALAKEVTAQPAEIIERMRKLLEQ